MTQKQNQEIVQLSQLAQKAIQTGQEQLALTYWTKILQQLPNHIPTLTEMGKYALSKGEIKAAVNAFQRVVTIDGKEPQQWINLAITYQQVQDEQNEEYAIQQALKADPGDLLALIMRADLYRRQDKKHLAAKTFGAVASIAPSMEKLHPSLHSSIQFARQYKEEYESAQGNFLDEFLDSHYQQMGGENLQRFRDSVDILLGRKKRYDSQSMVFHYPNLLPIEFFEREEFPWLAEIEAGTNDIRDEFLQILQAEKGFTPYLVYPEGQPLNQFAELNNSPDWSAFHLCKNGIMQEENIKQCPKTMALIAQAPQPIQLGRTPTSMFSLLKPKTKIPAHVGVSNVRLVTHIPLIIPADCGFRVGNQTREWELGKAFIFDDTIEHEAWNNSDKLRVVLIFDIWHPHLSLAERDMISALSEGLAHFRTQVS